MKYEGETYSFMFDFHSRDQFYKVIHTLNCECGKGNWTIKGRVLKSLKRIEKYSTFYKEYKEHICKEIIVPANNADIQAYLLFVHETTEWNKK